MAHYQVQSKGRLSRDIRNKGRLR